MGTLAALPPELTHEILSYLPTHSLLSFGQTSRQNHAIERASLSTLHLGIFHCKLNSLLSFCGTPPLEPQPISIILRPRQTRTRDSVINAQNAVVCAALSAHTQTLRDLDLVLWELSAASARLVAQASQLRRLSIRLDHPAVRHADVNRHAWETAPASTVWNALAGKLGRLESLTLERCGVTDYQLTRLLEANPGIRDLRLQKCLGLGEEFFEWLAGSPLAENLETLVFAKSAAEEIDERVLKYIARLPRLKYLSFQGCSKIDGAQLLKLNDEEWHIRDVMPPQAPAYPAAIEVDPEYA